MKMDKDKKAEYITVDKRYLCPDCLEKFFCPVCNKQKRPDASLCKECREEYRWYIDYYDNPPYFRTSPKEIAKFYRGFKKLGVIITPQLRDTADDFLADRAKIGNHPTASEYLEEIAGKAEQLKLSEIKSRK